MTIAQNHWPRPARWLGPSRAGPGPGGCRAGWRPWLDLGGGACLRAGCWTARFGPDRSGVERFKTLLIRMRILPRATPGRRSWSWPSRTWRSCSWLVGSYYWFGWSCCWFRRPCPWSGRSCSGPKRSRSWSGRRFYSWSGRRFYSWSGRRSYSWSGRRSYSWSGRTLRSCSWSWWSRRARLSGASRSRSAPTPARVWATILPFLLLLMLLQSAPAHP